jgi:hypothetical protein
MYRVEEIFLGDIEQSVKDFVKFLQRYYLELKIKCIFALSLRMHTFFIITI